MSTDNILIIAFLTFLALSVYFIFEGFKEQKARFDSINPSFVCDLEGCRKLEANEVKFYQSANLEK